MSLLPGISPEFAEELAKAHNRRNRGQRPISFRRDDTMLNQDRPVNGEENQRRTRKSRKQRATTHYFSRVQGTKAALQLIARERAAQQRS